MNGHGFEAPSRHVFYRLALAGLALTVAVAGGAAGQDASPDLTPPADAAQLPSGILSTVLTAGTGESYPSDNHLVALDFVGYSPGGDKLYSSYDLGKPLIVTLSTLPFAPWREPLEQMVVGEKRRIWLPNHLVATLRGPKGASIFDLELRGLKSVPSPPENLEKPPEDAQTTPSGAATVLLEAGTGSEYPDHDSTVLVHYMGWTANGASFDSSFSRGRPTAFPLDQVMPAFAETVQMMVVREKRRVWIPGPVAAGNWVGSPKGPLVFEIELVRILPDDALQKAQPVDPSQTGQTPAPPGTNPG